MISWHTGKKKPSASADDLATIAWVLDHVFRQRVPRIMVPPDDDFLVVLHPAVRVGVDTKNVDRMLHLEVPNLSGLSLQVLTNSLQSP